MPMLSGRGAWIAATQGGATTVTLSGTSGSPNIDSDTFNGPYGAATAGWTFTTTGTVVGVTTGQFQDGIEWTSEQDSPVLDYWLRATVDSGDTPSGTIGSWSKVAGSGSTNQTYNWTRSGTVGTTAGTVKIEIATDSGGSNIVGTGYYRGEATVT